MTFKIPRFSRERLHYLLIFVLTFSFYVITMPKTVTMEDSGSFILYSYGQGAAHQPGYPIYTMLAKLFMFVPVGNIAMRVHFMSACFASLTCLLIYSITLLVVGERQRHLCYFAALLFAVSRAFWSQAIIAEVYTLNTFFFFLLFLLCLIFHLNKNSRILKWIAFVYGLSLTNHWPLIQLSLPGLLILLWLHRKEVLRKIGILIPLFFLGLTPYVYMYFRSQMNPDFSFQGSLNNLSDLWYFVSRQNYAELEKSTSSSFSDQVQMASFFTKQIFREFTFVGGILGILGAFLQWRRWPFTLCVSLALCFLGSSYILISLLQVDYDFFWTVVYRVYPLIPYGVFSIWIILSLDFLSKFLSRSNERKRKVTFGLLGTLLTIGTALNNMEQNYRHHDTWTYDFAKATLESLEPNAIYFTHEDWDVGPLGYVNCIEGVRSDVTLFNDKALVFSNRLFRAVRPKKKDQEESLHQFIQSTDRPIYYTNELMPSPHPSVYCGFFRRVGRGMPDSSQLGVELKGSIVEYFEKIVDAGEPTDLLARAHRYMLMGKMTATLTPIVYGDSKGGEEIKKYEKLLEKSSATYLGKLRMVDMLINMGYDDTQFLWRTLDEAESYRDHCLHRTNWAKLDAMRARIKHIENDFAGYVKYLEKSFRIFPNKDNIAGKKLLDYYEGSGNILKAIALLEKYPFLKK